MKLTAPTNYPWHVLTDGYRPEGHPKGRHSGIDTGHGAGLDVYAMLPGTVVERRYHSEWGNRVVIQYSSDISVTANHLATLNDVPKLGAWVKQGQRIGTIGNTGKSFGAHLHSELEYGGRGPEYRIDPTPYFTKDLPGTHQGEEEMPLTDQDVQRVAEAVSETLRHHQREAGRKGDGTAGRTLFDLGQQAADGLTDKRAASVQHLVQHNLREFGYGWQDAEKHGRTIFDFLRQIVSEQAALREALAAVTAGATDLSVIESAAAKGARRALEETGLTPEALAAAVADEAAGRLRK